MNKLNDTQLETIIGGCDATSFIQSYADQDGTLFITGVRTKTFDDGTIMQSKRHKLIENASPESVSKTIASFKAQNMTTVIVGTGASSKEYSLDELSSIFC